MNQCLYKAIPEVQLPVSALNVEANVSNVQDPIVHPEAPKLDWKGLFKSEKPSGLLPFFAPEVVMVRLLSLLHLRQLKKVLISGNLVWLVNFWINLCRFSL
jgi:hypothetical protein